MREQAARHGASKIATFENVSDDVPSGIEALIELATGDDVDMVVVAVAGVIGLLPTLAAIEAGKQIGLASKEVLVAAGEIVMPLARAKGVEIVPIDSEHSAVFQCLRGYRGDQVGRLILTASGGPFRGKTRDLLKGVTVEQALNHPTWRMGGKITIDSATLMKQGAGGHRGAVAFRRAGRPDRRRGASPERGPLDGRADRRVGPRPTRLARHEASHLPLR